MTNTFSSIAIRMTIATGLVIGAVGVYASSQIGSLTQSFPSQSEFDEQPVVGNGLVQPLSGTIAPSTAKFNPEPNPEPISTGGTGTR